MTHTPTTNAVKTAALLAGLGGFMVLVGSLLGGATGTVIGLLFGLAIVGASYWVSDGSPFARPGPVRSPRASSTGSARISISWQTVPG